MNNIPGKLLKRVLRFRQDQRGITGLEKAIVLIAFAASLPVFKGQDLSMLGNLMLAALLSMTICNALAPKVALGGHPLNAASFGAVTCLMTGFNMLIIPPIASGILMTG